MTNYAVFYCDSCEDYKDPKESEYCKSNSHSIYSGTGKMNKEIKLEYKKLNKNSGNTLEQKDKAKKKINELQEKAGYPVTDWTNSENDIDESVTKKIYDFLKSRIIGLVISKDDSSQVYAKIKTEDHIEILNLNSSKAVNWLMYHHRNMTDELYDEAVYKTALKHIKADSQNDGSPVEPIYNRIAQVNGQIYYDLCRSDWTIVIIKKDGTYLVDSLQEHHPVFERHRSNVEQVLPDEVSKVPNALEDLCVLLRIKEKVLFKVHLVHMFCQDQATPFMFFDGEHGSVKTTTTQMIKKTIDPSSSNIGSFSAEKKELQSNISNKYLIPYDNVSGFDHNVSDLLCRALSGDEISKRALYTNNEQFVKSYSKKKFVFNGISPNIEFPDFNDRTLYYKTSCVPADEKESESNLWAKHEKLLPHVLNQIFNTISKVQGGAYDEIGAKIKPKSRLGDFEKCGETISQILGHKENEFSDLYYQKRKEIAVKDNDSFPIIRVIESMMNSRPNKEEAYENSTTMLYDELTKLASLDPFNIDTRDRFSNWPKKSQFLSQQLNKLKAQFREENFEIQISTYAKADPPEWHNRSVTKIIPIPIKESGISPRQARHPDKIENQSQNQDDSCRADNSDNTDNSDTINHHDKQPNPTNHPDSKNEDSSHENCGLSGCRDCRDDSDSSFIAENTDDSINKYWICGTCHINNPDLIDIEESDEHDKSLQWHSEQDHNVRQFTESEKKDNES